MARDIFSLRGKAFEIKVN